MTGTRRQKTLRKALREIAPRVPMIDAEAILDTASAGHLRHLPPSIALWQATTSRIRHAHTDYDALLKDDYDRDAARYFVLDDMNEILTDWGSSKRLDHDLMDEA